MLLTNLTMIWLKSGYYSKVTEIEFNKPLVITKKDHKDFKNFAKCWICKKVYKEDEVKVKDHNHITEKY